MILVTLYGLSHCSKDKPIKRHELRYFERIEEAWWNQRYFSHDVCIASHTIITTVYSIVIDSGRYASVFSILYHYTLLV